MFMQEDEDIPFHERLFQTQKTLAEQTFYLPESKEFLRSIGKSAKTEDISKMNIAIDETFLGFTSLHYSEENIFAPPISIIKHEGGRVRANPLVILIIAPKGAGKTTLMKVIAQDNFEYKTNIPTVIIDPATNPEWYLSNYAITDPNIGIMSKEKAEKVIEFGKRINWLPHAYSGVVYKPKFTNEGFKEEGTDKDYVPTLEDYKDLYFFSPIQAEKELLSALGKSVSDSSNGEAYVHEAITNKKYKKISDIIAMQNDESYYKSFEKLYGKCDTFFQRLNYLMATGAIADKPADNQRLLEDIKEKSFVVLRALSISEEEESQTDNQYQSIMRMWLTKIINEQLKGVSGIAEQSRQSLLNHLYGFQLVSDEIDKLAPAKKVRISYTRGIFNRGVDKERKNKMTVAGATQDISLVSERLVGSTDIFLFAKPSDPASEEGKSNGTIPYLEKAYPEYVDEIKNLKWQQTNDFDMKVSQWFIITKDKDILTRYNKGRKFYPIWSKSAFKA